MHALDVCFWSVSQLFSDTSIVIWDHNIETTVVSRWDVSKWGEPEQAQTNNKEAEKRKEATQQGEFEHAQDLRNSARGAKADPCNREGTQKQKSDNAAENARPPQTNTKRPLLQKVVF